MRSDPRVSGGVTLMEIGCKYNSRNFLGFIATGGGGSTEPGDPCLSCFPEFFSNVSVHPVVRPHLLGRYLNACNAIENHNRMRHSDLALEKYWLT